MDVPDEEMDHLFIFERGFCYHCNGEKGDVHHTPMEGKATRK